MPDRESSIEHRSNPDARSPLPRNPEREGERDRVNIAVAAEQDRVMAAGEIERIRAGILSPEDASDLARELHRTTTEEPGFWERTKALFAPVKKEKNPFNVGFWTRAKTWPARSLVNAKQGISKARIGFLDGIDSLLKWGESWGEKNSFKWVGKVSSWLDKKTSKSPGFFGKMARLLFVNEKTSAELRAAAKDDFEKNEKKAASGAKRKKIADKLGLSEKEIKLLLKKDAEEKEKEKEEEKNEE